MKYKKYILFIWTITLLFSMFYFINAASYTYLTGEISIVKGPVCNNGNYLSIWLKNKGSETIETEDIIIRGMKDGIYFVGYEIQGEWGHDSWKPGEEIPLGIRFSDSDPFFVTDFELKWLYNTFIFENPCLNLRENTNAVELYKTKVYRCFNGVKTFLGEVSWGDSNFCDLGENKYLIGTTDRCLPLEDEPRECWTRSVSNTIDYVTMDNSIEVMNITNDIVIKKDENDYLLSLLKIGDGWADIFVENEKWAMIVGETVSKDLDNDNKDDLSIKLIEANKENAKIEISKPSKLNFNYFWYFLFGLLIIVLLIYGSTKIKTKFKNRKDKKRIDEKSIKETHEESLKSEKSKIPKNITSAIKVRGFTVKHGSKTILNNVDININRGDFVALLGASGTGKSTIIESLVNRKKPTNGSVKIFDKDINLESSIFRHVGFVPQNPELYSNQTVEQNLKNSAIKWGIENSDEKIEKILDKINLKHRKNLKAGKLSGGQSKLLSLGMELIREPELIILDEPTTGLDPNTRNNVITILSNLSHYNHKTILITTHFMDDAEEADEIILVGNKKILVQGTPEKLEKRLPGGGKVISIILDNVTEDLMNKIDKIESVEKVIREGRSLNILTNNPDPIEMASKIKGLGGSILESKIVKASMKEVFVYYTGQDLPEN